MSTLVQKICEQLSRPSDCLIDITDIHDKTRYFYRIKKKAGKISLTRHVSGEKGSKTVDVYEAYCPSQYTLCIREDEDKGYIIEGSDIVFLHIVETRDILFFKEKKDGTNDTTHMTEGDEQ